MDDAPIPMRGFDPHLFRDAFNASPIGIVVEDLEGQPLFVNQAFCTFLGFSEEELRDKHCVDFSPPEDAKKDWDLFQQLRGGLIDHYQLEKRYFRKDGSLVWGKLSISLGNASPSSLVIAMVEDITAKKVAEEQLRASEERLRLAQWAAHIGTFDLNLRTGEDIWQPETEALYGLPPGGFGGTLNAFEDLIHPEDRERIVKLTQEMMRTGRPAEEEWRVVWPDGSVHWIAARGQVFMDESGEPSRMLGVNMDITERKLVQEELVRINERLHLAVESGLVGGWEWDIKGDKTYWFGKAHAQLGITPDETMGSREEFWDRVHEDDRDDLRHAMRLARVRHEAFIHDFRVVWGDGATHWLRSRGRYYYSTDGEPERMLGISLDVTQSKQAEEALRASEERFRLAVQAGKMYSFDWDLATDAVVRSPECVKVLGDVAPRRSSHKQFMEKVHPDDRAQFNATIAELTPENPTAEVIFRIMISDDAVVWLRSSGRAFFDKKGTMQRVIGMVTDITDIKRAEDALTGMTRKLIESQEQERTRIGRELHDDINQRLVMLGVELQQLQDNPSETPSRVQDLRQQVVEISNDVQALLHQLHSSKLDYLGVIAGMRSWCREVSVRQKIEIDFHSDVSSVLPLELGRSLFRVLQEALHNAIKHSGVKRFEVQVRERPSEIHLLISDAGRGFSLEEALQGPGLGLTSMRERIRLVNGTIAIDSKPMGGTTVHVRVPLEPERGSELAG